MLHPPPHREGAGCAPGCPAQPLASSKEGQRQVGLLPWASPFHLWAQEETGVMVT